jgi:hypothetical protein
MQRTGMENQTQLRIAINAATRANLSFYTVDVRGLEAIIPGGAAGGAGLRTGSGNRGGGTNAYSGRGMLSQLDTNFASQKLLSRSQMTPAARHSWIQTISLLLLRKSRKTRHRITCWDTSVTIRRATAATGKSQCASTRLT